MRLFWCVYALCLLLLSPTHALELSERPDLNRIFAKHHVSGTFVLFDTINGNVVAVNKARAAKRFIPASTFKIANSLIALETGAIPNEIEKIPYGGKPQPFKAWEKDMGLRDAIRVSNVPVYQQLALRIGYEQYQRWLPLISYGNLQIGDDLQTFWLEGPLKISAVEQVEFLGKLVSGKTPFSTRNVEIVKQITVLGRKGDKTLNGKTGWTIEPDPDIGWFVGWVSDKSGHYPFALNIDIEKRDQVRLRKTLAFEFLAALGRY